MKRLQAFLQSRAHGMNPVQLSVLLTSVGASLILAACLAIALVTWQTTSDTTLLGVQLSLLSYVLAGIFLIGAASFNTGSFAIRTSRPTATSDNHPRPA